MGLPKGEDDLQDSDTSDTEKERVKKAKVKADATAAKAATDTWGIGGGSGGWQGGDGWQGGGAGGGDRDIGHGLAGTAKPEENRNNMGMVHASATTREGDGEAFGREFDKEGLEGNELVGDAAVTSTVWTASKEAVNDEDEEKHEQGDQEEDNAGRVGEMLTGCDCLWGFGKNKDEVHVVS